MNLAGVVVLYHPDDSVYSNILSYVDELDVLYVVDNSDLTRISDKEKQVINKILTLKRGGHKVQIVRRKSGNFPRHQLCNSALSVL